MEPTSVRCPRCRKKQAEPCPKRCGCGESLLNVLAARRVLSDTRRPAGTAENRRGMEGPPALPHRSPSTHAHTLPVPESLDNEW
jgi:hypothetical protein